VVRYLPNVSGEILEIEFLRHKGSTAVGLTYAAQFSSNLLNSWVAGLLPTVTSINAAWERVVVRDSVAGPHAMRFGKGVTILQ
jgi:hypothetical protein